MPAETRNYVPKLQAVKNIVRDPEVAQSRAGAHPGGALFHRGANEPEDGRQDRRGAGGDAAGGVPVAQPAAQQAGHRRRRRDDDPAALRQGRSCSRRSWRCPISRWSPGRRTRPSPTKRLPQLALRFGLPLETLRTVNGIGARATVPVGHALLVPTQAPNDATVASLQNAVFTTVASARTLYHRVRKGETLSSIAAHYAVSAQELKGWNVGMNPKSDRRPASASHQ
mgnify:CR=1 FL=1